MGAIAEGFIALVISAALAVIAVHRSSRSAESGGGVAFFQAIADKPVIAAHRSVIAETKG
jgi:hypothetical protein